MKVALIVPKNLIISSDKFKKYNWNKMQEFNARKRLWSVPDLSLLTVAGMFPEEFSVDYYDLNYETGSEFEDYDMVFFSPSTSQVTGAYLLADEFRKKGSLIVMGGVHVSMMPEEALEHSDVVFVGEAEETFAGFLDDLKNGSCSRVYRAMRFPDLALTPVPRYELARKYSYSSIPVQTSRGCPHQCTFCVSSKLYGMKYRRKSFVQVKQELEKIKGIWNNPFVFFTDDNMFIDVEYSYRLLEYLGEMGIRWYAFSDAAIADRDDMLQKMADANCAQLLIGFESLSTENLADINRSRWKMKKRSEYERIIDKIQSYGIGVVGSFVIGLDGDMPDVFTDLYDFIENTRLYATNITTVTPFPGTEFYRGLQQQKRIFETDWSKYNGFELTFELKNMKPLEFEEGMGYLYEKLDSPERISAVLNYFKDIIQKRNQKRGKGCENQ